MPSVVLNVTATFIGVFREFHTKYFQPASFFIPEPLWMYLRDRDIPERVIIEVTGGSPEVPIFKRI